MALIFPQQLGQRKLVIIITHYSLLTEQLHRPPGPQCRIVSVYSKYSNYADCFMNNSQVQTFGTPSKYSRIPDSEYSSIRPKSILWAR